MSWHKVLTDGTTYSKDIHFYFIFMSMYKKASVMQKHFTYWLRMKENDAMRPISNERPEFLVLEKYN